MLGCDFGFKVITAGDGGVGKTSLLTRFVSGIFIENLQMTIGVQFFQKIHLSNSHKYRLTIWDLGGEDQFRKILPNYIMGCFGAILMFDLTRMITLKNVQEWIKLLRANEEIPIILVGSKKDLLMNIKSEYDLSTEYDYILEIKERYGLCDYVETSSKTGLNIERVFDSLLREIIKFKKLR